MALSQRLDLRQSQSLVMTPQLQQAIKLLQLSNLELAGFLEQELEQNPLLERDESDPMPPVASPDDPNLAPEPGFSPETTPDAAEVLGGGDNFAQDDTALWQAERGAEGAGDHELAGDASAGPGAGDAESWAMRGASGPAGGDLPGLDETLRQETTLRDHLVSQLNCDIADPADRLIGLHLIDLVDEAGYLRADLDEAAAMLGCDRARVEAVLAQLQRFDPSGIFARDLAECLAIQLRERDRLDPCMARLLEHLPLLASRDAAQLMRVCGVDAEDLTEMVAELKALNPKPGLGFEGAPIQPVIPDILMRAQAGGGWTIELNAETLPRVLVNRPYFARVSRNLPDRSAREYLSERFQSANWLVKSLHQRANTILRVATEIVRKQDQFFTHGVAHLRPLILRDIAAAIGMHESTVSRVTSNKYIATPRGLFELKYFFTAAIPGADGAGTHSAEAVRFHIKGLIESESADQVLSDDRIVEMLRDTGIEIARRTVAKYREAMRIPSSVLRRREKMLQI